MTDRPTTLALLIFISEWHPRCFSDQFLRVGPLINGKKKQELWAQESNEHRGNDPEEERAERGDALQRYVPVDRTPNADDRRAEAQQDDPERPSILRAGYPCRVSWRCRRRKREARRNVHSTEPVKVEFVKTSI